MLSVENLLLVRHSNGPIVIYKPKSIDVVFIMPTVAVTQSGATSMKLKSRSNGRGILMIDGKTGSSLGLGLW